MVIDEAKCLTDTKVLYFYCRYTDPQDQRRTFVAMARSFLAQLLRSGDSMVSYLFEYATSEGDSRLRTRKSAEELLEVCLKDTGRIYIIVDGLDECPEHEQKAIVSWLRKYVDSSSSEPEPSRCLFLSQFDGAIRSMLSSIPTLSIRPDDNKADIHAFCQGNIGRIRTKFGLDDLESIGIVSTTSARADGKLS